MLAATLDWTLSVNVVLVAVLVGVTFWYARSTRDILRENQRLARATVALARTSGQALFLQSFPVVVAHSGGGTMSGDVIDLKMRYVNIGTGAALNAVFSMSYQGVDLIRLEVHPLVQPGQEDQIGGRAQNALARNVFNDLEACIYAVEYADMMGNKYRTRRQSGVGVEVYRLGPGGEELATSFSPETVGEWIGE